MAKKVVKLPTPLDYQKEIIDWLEDADVKFVSFLKSRQSGGSFLNKLLVAKWGLTENNIKIGYVCPTYKLGKLFFSELAESLKPFISEANKTDLIIKFVTGSYVQFFSAEAGDAMRGFQHHYTILDEVSFMNDDIINLIIKPTWLIIGKKIVSCSTPNGNQGFFYENCQYGLNGTPHYKTKTISIYDNPFISKEEIALIKKQMPEKVWRQEYLGEFLDGSGTVFSNFKECIGEGRLTGNYYAAIDWAKQNDYTVVTIINDLKEVVHIYRITGMDYILQVKNVVALLNKWKPIVTLSEENNIGAVVNELLREQYKGRIRQITLNNTNKKEMIENLVVGFEQGDIIIPDNDTLLRELQAFTCIYNPQTQSVKYTAPNGLHDDMVISLAYAYSLVKTKVGRYSVL